MKRPAPDRRQMCSPRVWICAPCFLLLVSALLLTSTEVLQAADPGTPGEDEATLSSKISAVTVYADRARVTRSASIDLTDDTRTFAFRKLPGWIDEGSIRLAVTPAEAGQLLDVQVEKTFLSRLSDEEVRKAEAGVREINDQILALDDEKAVLDARERQIDAIRAFSLEKLPRDMAVREVKMASYAEVVDFVSAGMRQIVQGRRELERRRRDLVPELSVRQRQLEELRQRAQLEQRSVLVTLKGTGSRKATLTLTYLLPGATWEPVHELRAGRDARAVALASYAVVTQTTGEDWQGAEINLSTQRPSATLFLPELDALLVGSGRSMAKLVGGDRDTYEVSEQAYVAQNALWDSVNRGAKFQKEYLDNEAVQRSTQARVREVFAALQERGTTAHFQALGRQSIRADGRLVRVPIGSVELDAKHRILAAPEVSLNAAHTVDLSNTGTQPLLPGRVSLYLEGAFLGVTEMGFVAQGEPFSLFLGVADRVKLTRTLDSRQSSLVRDGRRTRMQVAFVEGVENLSDREVTVQLTERVPVSETEDVKVRNIRIQPEAKPDEKGLLRSELVLAPRQKREFRIEYTIEYPTGLPQRAPSNIDEEAPSPAAAPPANIYKQLDQLERSLQ